MKLSSLAHATTNAGSRLFNYQHQNSRVESPLALFRWLFFQLILLKILVVGHMTKQIGQACSCYI